MAERAKADCGANLIERSYSLNGARFVLVARGTALSRRHASGLGLTEFQAARDLAARLGLVPRQFTTGGKTKLLGIRKRGNKYLRKLLIHGVNWTPFVGPRGVGFKV
jgi:transposase